MSIEPINFEKLQFTRADRLRKSLHAAGMSSQEMADYLGVNRNTISRYINDEREPKRSVLLLWALRTGVPMEWIETGNTPTDNNGGGGDEGMVNIYFLPKPTLDLVA